MGIPNELSGQIHVTPEGAPREVEIIYGGPAAAGRAYPKNSSPRGLPAFAGFVFWDREAAPPGSVDSSCGAGANLNEFSSEISKPRTWGSARNENMSSNSDALDEVPRLRDPQHAFVKGHPALRAANTNETR